MYIHLKDNLGNPISEGTGLTPLTTPSLLATTNSVTDPISVTIYTDGGYASVGETVISFVGASAAKWTVCATEGGTYGSTLTLTEPVTATGTAVFVKASSSADETTPVNDTATDIHIASTIGAV